MNAGGLTINGAGGTLNLGAGRTHTITTNLTLTNGTLDGGSSTLNFGGTSVTVTSGTLAGASGTINYNNAGAQTIAPITYSNLTLSGSGVKTITTLTTVTVNGILSMEGTATLTTSGSLVYTSGAGLQYNRATTMPTGSVGSEWKSPFTGTGGVKITNIGTITIPAGKTLNDGVPLTIDAGAVLANGSNPLTVGGTFTNNGYFTASNADLTLRGNFVNTGSFTLGNSRIILDGTAIQSIAGFTTSGSLTMRKTGGTATFTGNITAGSLVINGAGGTLNLGSGLVHTFNGSWTLTSGTLEGGSSTMNVTGSESGTGAVFSAGTSTINYSGGGPSSQNVGGLTYFNLSTSVPSGSATKSTMGPVTVNGSLSVGTGSILEVKGYTITVVGATTVNGTLRHIALGGTKTYTGLVTVNGIWDNYADVPIHFRGGFLYNGTSFPVDVGSYIFETNDQVIGGGNPFTIPSMTIDGITLTNNGTVAVNVDINNVNDVGNLVQGTGATLKIGGTLSVPLTAMAASNTVIYSGATQTITAMTYFNLGTSGSSIKTLGGDVTLNGSLNVSGGTTLTVPGVNFSVAGATTVGGSLIHNNAAGLKTYNGLVTISTGGTWNNSGSSDIYLHGGLAFSGTTFAAGSGMYTFDTNAQAIGGSAAFAIPSVTINGVILTNNNTSAGGFSITTELSGSGSILQGAPNPTLNIGVTTSVGLNAAAVPNTVNYNGADQRVIATPYNNLTLSGSGVKSLSEVTTVSGDLNLSGSASATTAADMTVSGNLTLRNTSALSVAGFGFSVAKMTHLYNISTLTHTSRSGAAKSYGGDVTLEGGTTWFDNADSIDISFGGSLSLIGSFSTGQGFQAGQGVHTFSGSGKVFSGTISIPNITITGSYTNNGSLTAGNSLAGSGLLTQGTPNPYLNLGGTTTINALNALAVPNTVTYNMVGDQSIRGEDPGNPIRSVNYYNLSTAGTNTKTLGGRTVVRGSISIGANTTLDASTSNYPIDLYGTWTNNGAFNARAGTVSLVGAGPSAQAMSGSASFYNLVVNNGFGVSLLSTETVNNILTLTNGKVITGSTRNLILGVNGSISGADSSKYINGNLQKNFSTGPQTFTYDIGDASAYTPMTLSFANITSAGGVVVKASTTNPDYIAYSGLDLSHHVNRYWTLTTTTLPVFSTYNVTFNYLSGDIDPGSDPNTFIVQREVGNITGPTKTWSPTTIGARSDTSTQVIGVNAIGVSSIFAIGQADATPPVVANVTSTKTNGSYKANDQIPISVVFNEPVVVTGFPSITLHTAGLVNQIASYTPGGPSPTLIFNYTVQPGDTSSDLDYLAADSLSLNGGTIVDCAGNSAVLALPNPGETGSLSSNKDIVIDTTTPSVTNVDSTASDGTYSHGSLDITVTFSEPVTVTVTPPGVLPSLILETGAVDQPISYTGPVGGNTFSNTLTFTYIIQPGDSTPDLDYVAVDSLQLKNGAIRDRAGNNASVTLPTPGIAGSLAANRAIVIDTIAAASSVTSSASDGPYHAGAIPISVTFTWPVVVTGTPTLTLETGAPDRLATYTSGSGTDTLIFTYTIQSGDTTADLDYVDSASLSPAGGSIKDTGGMDARLTLPAPGAAGSLGASKAIVIDTTPPTTSIDSESQPPQYDKDTTPTFAFSGTDESGSGIRTFKCKIDEGTYTDCSSPFTQNPALADGPHTFYVYAEDYAGNVDVTPATASWTVDATPPTTTITDTHPELFDNDSTPAFTFTGDDTGSGVASFMCRVDSGLDTPCNSGMSWSVIPDGYHTFYVSAVDRAGNVDPTPDSYSWTVDITPPNTTISVTDHPSDPSQDNTPTFFFTGDDGTGSGIASFRCRMDSGSYSVCSSGLTWTVLSDGSHTFSVYAIDQAGNPDTTPDSFTWLVDTTAPSTTLSGKPPAADSDTTPDFTFSGSDGTSGSGVASYMCKLETDISYSLCTSPFTPALPLADGSHTFSVYAIDHAGNANSTPTTHTWTVDTLPPDTSITGHPDALDGDHTPTFSFMGNDGSGIQGFMCKMDEGTYVSCSSPWTSAELDAGPHTFHVYAIDAAGNADLTPASFAWTVKNEYKVYLPIIVR